jgi:hypothetical protein
VLLMAGLYLGVGLTYFGQSVLRRREVQPGT